MRFAYADPPYLGMCGIYDHEHVDGGCWNDVETHRLLIERLATYDGWAMSLSTPSLRTILPLCPDAMRVGAWVKPFASFKPGVNPGYAWEPIIFVPSPRKRDRAEATVRDWFSCSITLERGFVGAKPEAVIRWLMDLIGVHPEDEVDDIFVGSGAAGRAIAGFVSQPTLMQLLSEPATLDLA